MEFLQPRSLAEAIAAKAEHLTAVPIAGGTDVMVEINLGLAAMEEIQISGGWTGTPPSPTT